MLAVLFGVLCVIWSTTWAAIRVCEQGFSPLWAAALRFSLGAGVLLVLLSWRGGRSARPASLPLARWVLPAAGLINALSYSLIYLAERRLTGGTAAVLGATNPFFTLGVAVALGYERASWRKGIGLTVGFGGVCLLVSSGLTLGTGLVPSMLEVLFAAAVLWPTYSVLLRRANATGLQSQVVTAGFVRWTAIFLLLAAGGIEGVPGFLTGGLPSARAVGALFYLAVLGTAVAWSLFNFLLRRLPLSVLSTMLFIEPGLALGVDWLLGDTAPSAAGLSGAALILAGVALSAWSLPRDVPIGTAAPLVA